MSAAGLRVGVLAPIAWRVPPRHYGPWEQFASSLAEGLVARGADVTLFASGDSLTSARLVSVVDHGYEEVPDPEVKVTEALHVSGVFERAAEFDIIHNGFDFLPVTYSRLVTTPVITTIHGLSSERLLAVFEPHDDHAHYVAISAADRRPSLHYAATIHHGVDPASFNSTGERGDHLLFLGRIHPEKGTVAAIDVARRSGRPLVIAGIVADRAYFDAEVAPLIDGTDVRYVGPVGPVERAALLGGAHALVHLISFAEPFGYSVVEAMVSGTPVIAHPLGSMPELIVSGRDGFLVGSVAEAVDATAAVAGLDRGVIAAAAVARFSVDRMVDRYVEVYRQILGG